MGLQEYRKKRTFAKTLEPKGKKGKKTKEVLSFVIQKHAARHLHWDLRLEIDGVLKSWAIPKEPSSDTSVKRLAIEVEDHPIEYGTFEGEIPKGEYGAGTVEIWDRGTYAPTHEDGDDPNKIMREEHKKGHMKFVLKGKKLKGPFVLVRMHKPPYEKKEWLFFKVK